MKYVPSNPPPVDLIDTYWPPKSPSGVRPIKPVQARTTPPLATSHYQASEEPPAKELPVSNTQEKRISPGDSTERRTVCRRIFSRPVLIELRSSVNRRQNRQRETDRLENISQQV